MAPKRKHAGAEPSLPPSQASPKRLKLTSTNALAPSKRVSGHLMQKALAQRIKSLPQELQDEILEHLLAASLPSKPARLTIGDNYATFTFPLALKINRKTRAKYAEQFFRQGQMIVVGAINDDEDAIDAIADRALEVVDEWFSVVDAAHIKLVTDIRIQAPSGEEYVSDIADYYPEFDRETKSISSEAVYSHYAEANRRPWSALKPHGIQRFIVHSGLPYFLYRMHWILTDRG